MKKVLKVLWCTLLLIDPRTRLCKTRGADARCRVGDGFYTRPKPRHDQRYEKWLKLMLCHIDDTNI